VLDTLLSMSTTRDIRVETDPDRLRPIDADLQVPDTAKFREHTGWAPEYSFKQTMQDLLDYWRDRLGRHPQSLVR
jgi:GDPmannose 4,6-dehydratase